MRRSYVHSPAKSGIHELLLAATSLGPETGRILSLGGPECRDLKLFAEKGYQVVSLEWDEQVFAKQQKEVGHVTGITLIKDTVEHYLTTLPRQVPFQLAFIDLCGNYTKKREEAILKFARSDRLVPGGLLAVTFKEGHERQGDMRGSTALKKCGGSLRKFIRSRRETIRKTLGPKWPWLSIKYSRGNGAAQMLFMLTRKERRKYGT